LFFSPAGPSFYTIISKTFYFDRVYLRGEDWSPYLGFIGIFCFFYFTLKNFILFCKNKIKVIPIHFWYLLWILLYSTVGGINLIFGTIGFQALRSTNIYSILIFLIILIFTLRYFSKRKLLSTFLILFLVWASVWYEQLSWRFDVPASVNLTPNKILLESDQKFINDLESVASGTRRVFTLPVMKFPENGPINNMPDYTHMRLFLNSKDLHFSFGSNYGRFDYDWQYDVQKLEPMEMLNKLIDYKFEFIVINKNGYIDKANKLIDYFNKNLIHASENEEYIAFKINKSNSNYISPIILFDANWSVDEISHRWAINKKNNITLNSFNISPIKHEISFDIFTMDDGYIDIYFNDDFIKRIKINLGEKLSEKFDIYMLAGKNKLSFRTNIKPRSPGKHDQRKLNFALSNFKIFKND